jgi:hypothetical protein
VNVHVPQTWNQELPDTVKNVGSDRRPMRVASPNAFNAITDHDDGHVRLRRRTCRVDNRDVLDRQRLRPRLGMNLGT